MVDGGSALPCYKSAVPIVRVGHVDDRVRLPAGLSPVPSVNDTVPHAHICNVLCGFCVRWMCKARGGVTGSNLILEAQ